MRSWRPASGSATGACTLCSDERVGRLARMSSIGCIARKGCACGPNGRADARWQFNVKRVAWPEDRTRHGAWTSFTISSVSGCRGRSKRIQCSRIASEFVKVPREIVALAGNKASRKCASGMSAVVVQVIWSGFYAKRQTAAEVSPR